ncbi:unnamed protein product [Nezara viridula]|uniref:Uncharacterized protein n=1 Tax=Nezara viridula TaxID=85310 RepID=A0A9P0MPY4_NEZVI|nr:unnamed protein product [Nezara viridula]
MFKVAVAESGPRALELSPEVFESTYQIWRLINPVFVRGLCQLPLLKWFSFLTLYPLLRVILEEQYPSGKSLLAPEIWLLPLGVSLWPRRWDWFPHIVRSRTRALTEISVYILGHLQKTCLENIQRLRISCRISCINWTQAGTNLYSYIPHTLFPRADTVSTPTVCGSVGSPTAF